MSRFKALGAGFLGVLPAILFLAACSSVMKEDRQDPNTTGPSARPVSPDVSTLPANELETMAAPNETDLANRMTPTGSPGQKIDLNQPGLSYQRLILADGSVLDFVLRLPESFEPDQSHPVLLALPPGTQSRDMVDAGLDSYWTPGSAGRDWIVISPIAPAGRLFFQGSERLLPEFLEAIIGALKVEGDRFHLAGISNGGISAFRIAILQPGLFHSMVVLPGFPTDQDFSKLDRLQEMPVVMFVGEKDTAWVEKMKKAQEELERLQVNSTLEIVFENGHFISSISGEQIFNLLDSYR